MMRRRDWRCERGPVEPPVLVTQSAHFWPCALRVDTGGSKASLLVVFPLWVSCETSEFRYPGFAASVGAVVAKSLHSEVIRRGLTTFFVTPRRSHRSRAPAFFSAFVVRALKCRLGQVKQRTMVTFKDAVLVSLLGVLPVFSMGCDSSHEDEGQALETEQADQAPGTPARISSSQFRAESAAELTDINGTVTFPTGVYYNRDEFGYSVALYAGYALVGASQYGLDDKGATYLLEWNSSTSTWGRL